MPQSVYWLFKNRSTGPPGPVRIATAHPQTYVFTPCRSTGPPGPVRIATESATTVRCTTGWGQHRSSGAGEDRNLGKQRLPLNPDVYSSTGPPGPVRIATWTNSSSAPATSKQQRSFGAGGDRNADPQRQCG